MARVTKINRTKPGILYILVFELEGKTLVKIGVTHRKIEDRVSEILISMFKKYRSFPYCKPKRFTTTNNIYKKEKTLHKHFSEYSYVPSKKFSGCTEFFNVDVDKVVDVYDILVKKKKVCKKKSEKPSKRKGVFFSVDKNV